MLVDESVVKKLNMLQPVKFSTKERAHFSDLDPFGHVNTEVYSTYYLKHRFSELRDKLGLDMKAISMLDVIFVTTNLSINFYKPIFGDDEFIISSKMVTMSMNNCIVECQIFNESKKLLSDCKLTLVCVDKKTLRSCNWPVEFISRFYINE